MTTSFWDLAANDANGSLLKFDQLKGNVVLVVNVASKCGFTYQYKELQQLYSKYKDQGFVILGAPCNQFGGQEPGKEAEIVEFCSLNYGVDFPILEKLEVNGDNTHPMYQWLKSQKKSLMMERIKWNFEKFLIGRDGQVSSRYMSNAGASAIEPELKKLLAEPRPEVAAPAQQDL